MVGVLELLRDIVQRKPEFAFLGDADRARAQQAIDKAVECILKTQVMQDGKLTVWCAQHDERTLAPAKARAYELPSLSGSESVGHRAVPDGDRAPVAGSGAGHRRRGRVVPRQPDHGNSRSRRCRRRARQRAPTTS